MTKHFTDILIILLATPSFAFGQLTKLGQASDFSPDCIKMDFGEIAYSDTPVGDAYAAAGILFVGEGDSSPKGVLVKISEYTPYPLVSALRNDRADGTSPNEALIMQFRYPVSRVGFDVGNGTTTTVARIKAFTATGEQLGTIEQNSVEERVGPFIGVETTHPAGISTLVLDYGDADEGEQLSSLRFDFLSPHTFRTYLPQIAHGRAGDRILETTIQMQALAKSHVRLSFFDSTGQPMALNLGGEEVNALEYSFPVLSSRRVKTDGPTDETRVGYAAIESDYPVEVQAIYQVTDQGSYLLSEAGIDASPSQFFQAGPVEYIPAQRLDTAIALVNTDNHETEVSIRVLNPDGTFPGWLRLRSITLAPGEHRAFFLSQVCVEFPELCETGGFPTEEIFQGSVVIRTNGEPVAATVLRTVEGLVISSVRINGTRQ